MHTRTISRADALLTVATLAALVAAPGCSLVTGFDGYHAADGEDGGGMDGGDVDAGGMDAGAGDADAPMDGTVPTDDAQRPDAQPVDANAGDAALTCVSDLDCDDGTFCNGIERCMPGAAGADARGCAPPATPRCAAGTTCDEGMDRCLTRCDIAPDADGDGVPSVDCGGADCDDSDASVRPGAPETCNGRDDNCNGTVDEGVAVTWYRDADGDGYGDRIMMRVGCALAGWVTLGNDCDDTNAAVNPGAVEICNGIDDDCNPGTVEPTTIFYRDGDGDGYGHPTMTMAACTAPAGYTTRAGDCDDSRSSVHPGARETCNAIDDDCNARVDDGLCDFGCGMGSGACDDPIRVAAGWEFHCVLTGTDRAVWCVGRNDAGQLGSPPGSPASSTTYRRVMGLPPGVTTISAGGAHACALTSAGEVWCWGGNMQGQLGNGTTAGSAMPVRAMIPGGVGSIVDVSAGFGHTCAHSTSGAACWGDNNQGQLGNGAVGGIRSTPVQVSFPGGTPVSAISAGFEHTCAIASGSVQCWGSNSSGELGRGGTAGGSYGTPAAVVTGSIAGSLRSVSAGRYTSCAATTVSTYCWGAGYAGQIGDGFTMQRTSPTQVMGAGSADYARLDVGYESVCAIRTGVGATHCWGQGANGELGYGSTTSTSVPVVVSGLPNGSHVSGSGAFFCALTTLSQVRCWGFNSSGQLGDGTTTARSVATPVVGPGL